MEALQPDRVLAGFERWLGQTVHVHLEVNPGAYWRNGSGILTQAHVKGDGPFRVFLEFIEGGLIQVDDLTHMDIHDNIVLCIAFDNQDRLARLIEVSPSPFRL